VAGVVDDTSQRLEALVGTAWRLVRTTRTGRLALAGLASTVDPAWLPTPWDEKLGEQLRDAAEAAREPLAFTDVESAVREADPDGELEQLASEPVAVTPTSQVHRGSLDGEPVAVKVLRPGLAATVRQDLALLEALVAPLDAAFPAVDAGATLREIRERVLDELDLEHEALIQRRFHRQLRRHPDLAVPAPVTRLCTENVLVSAWVDGVPLWQAPDPDRAAALLTRFTLGAARWGLAYADVDGDDVLVTGDGGLAIVDFGAVREVERDRLAASSAALDALADSDADALAGALAELGWLPPERAHDAMALARELLGELLEPGPTRLDTGVVVAVRERIEARAEAIGPLITAGRLAPEDLWPARGMGQLFGTIARLGATGDWVALAREALVRGI
jgi:predicted unusual protein kinase regulating ubiquinone biosynthesis (AarF/ABC1/UbiB family)